jgi:superoxide reductase
MVVIEAFNIRRRKMPEKLEIYKCNVCGNIVEVLHGGAGDLVCCNEPMQLLEENSTDAATEKHVPVVEKTEDGVKVKVGSVEHPMEEKHYIEWIEVECCGKTCTAFLKPGDKPEAAFPGCDCVKKVREYCNLHGLWKGG